MVEVAESESESGEEGEEEEEEENEGVKNETIVDTAQDKKRYSRTSK